MNDTLDFAVRKREKLKEPPDYKVILLNDDYTSMDFVTSVLIEVFHKNKTEARRLMMDIHQKGRGVAGVYTFDIAQSKVVQVHSLAASNDFPLECIMEKA